jgi:ParB family chromosome partitioning protein
MPDPLRSGLASASNLSLFTGITGKDARDILASCDTVPAALLPLVMLGPIVTAYESAMTGEAGKATWRPGRYSPCPRETAGRYLAFLASAGYQLSDIEQAVADGTPFTGDTPGEQLRGADTTGPADAGTATDTTGQPGSAGADDITDGDPGSHYAHPDGSEQAAA